MSSICVFLIFSLKYVYALCFDAVIGSYFETWYDFSVGREKNKQLTNLFPRWRRPWRRTPARGVRKPRGSWLVSSFIRAFQSRKNSPGTFTIKIDAYPLHQHRTLNNVALYITPNFFGRPLNDLATTGRW